MKWISVKDENPPWDIPVLGWNTCEKCRDGVKHMHNLLARSVPIHGPFLAVFQSPDPQLVAYRQSQGDHSWDHWLQPRWSPEEPSHWMKIDSPHLEGEHGMD